MTDARITKEQLAEYSGRPILKGYAGSGVMIALKIPTAIGEAMGPRQVPVDDMHVTIAYLGKMENVHPEAIKRTVDIVEEIAADWLPMKARIGGTGRFVASPSSDGRDVVYASFDCPLLTELRQRIVEELLAAGVPLKGTSHGFTPHVTTDLVEKGVAVEPPIVPDVEFDVPALCLYVGPEMVDFAFGAHTQPDAELETGDLGADLGDADAMALKMFKLDLVEKEDRTVVRKVAIIAKAEGDAWEQLVYGVVSEPDDVDADDQVQTAEDIKFAAHHFLGVQGITGYRHRQPADATVVESYLAPCDFEMGGQKVLAGSWVLVTRVNDEALWNEIVAGNITGYSVGGFGITEPLAG